jgi:hypothetical protein
LGFTDKEAPREETMAIVGTFCVLLVVLTTVIHYEVLRLVTGSLPTLAIPARTKLMVVIFGAFFAHAVEIFLYAGAFYVLVRYFGAGPLGHLTPSTLTLCLYFSAETYTSLGYGDVIPRGELRLLAGVEALNGLLLIGWSASFIYIAMERFWHDNDKENAVAVAQPGAAADAPRSTRR